LYSNSVKNEVLYISLAIAITLFDEVSVAKPSLKFLILETRMKSTSSGPASIVIGSKLTPSLFYNLSIESYFNSYFFFLGKKSSQIIAIHSLYYFHISEY
jgi:hypothetical protein